DPDYPTDPRTILNGDAHIRGSLFGASETFILEDGQLATGAVGYIYFVDWDQNRSRRRTCHVMVMGE
ncbi:MAG: YjbQ family protein, partial [Clostridiales bacterium]|nr:YjbQ family protein [Clostridiales bacterium]